LAGLRLRHRDVPNAHPLLLQKILIPQVRVYSISTTFNEPAPAGQPFRERRSQLTVSASGILIFLSTTLLKRSV
jgi:hypothetical protein